MYVVYEEESGKILSITPVEPEHEAFIEVDLQDVLSVHLGYEPMHNYSVRFNSYKKIFEFLPNSNYNEQEIDINELIYEIPVHKNDDYDIKVMQDCPEKCWKIFPGKDVSLEMNKQKISKNITLYFSITEKSNPNILYKQLSVNLIELLRDYYHIIPFEKEFEFQGKDVSLYTNKRFEAYIYEKINNE